MSDLLESPTWTVLAVALAAVFILAGVAKLFAVPSMRQRAAHVGFSIRAYRQIGVLEVLGACGVLVGLAVPVVGALAAGGLVLLMLGAIATHRRIGDRFQVALPAVAMALLANGYLLLTVGQL